MTQAAGAPLQDRVAIITGASSGIGFAIAKRFAGAGAKLVLAGRNREQGEASARALQDLSVQAIYVPTDVSREDEVRGLVDAAIDRFGTISILVNNAGPSGDQFGLSEIHALPNDAFETVMRVGAFSAFWCCKYAIPHMLEGGGGSIVNISAIPAVKALPLMGAYGMAKAALESLGRHVANDYATRGIRCNNLLVGTVRPGVDDVSTLPAGFDHQALDAAVAATTMLQRLGSYEDVAAMALFLASPDGGYITGASIPIEGGALGRLQYPDYRDIMSAAGQQ